MSEAIAPADRSHWRLVPHGAALREVEAELNRWLVRTALEATDEAMLLDGFCIRLAAAGVPLCRAATGAKLLHPLLDARGCRWLRGRGIVKEDYSRFANEGSNDPDWLTSPFYRLVHSTEEFELRRRLDDSYRRSEFPLLDRLQDDGCTDYLAMAVSYGRRVLEKPKACCARSRPIAREGSSMPSSICCGASPPRWR